MESNANTSNLQDPSELEENQVDIKLSSNNKKNLHLNFKKLIRETIEFKNEAVLCGDVDLIACLIAQHQGITVDEVKSLEAVSFKLSYESGMLNLIGSTLTNLKELTLNGSVIKTISDIGCSYRVLSKLNLKACKISDLSGLICFDKLEEIDMSCNDVRDLLELEMCSSIRKVNLFNNLVEDDENIGFLGGMEALEWVNLQANPIAKMENYLELMKNTLSENCVIDDEDKEFKSTPQTKSYWIKSKHSNAQFT